MQSASQMPIDGCADLILVPVRFFWGENEDVASLLMRIYANGKLVTDLGDIEVSFSILSKPDGKIVFRAHSGDRGDRLLFLEESYIYTEVPIRILEPLRPYDLRVEITKQGSYLFDSTLKSYIKVIPKTCNS